MIGEEGKVHLNPIRHLTLFDPQVFDKNRVDVVGCGAVGSRIAMEVAKLGIKNLHLWDDDVVAFHNIANQLYTLSDIGKLKVEALAEHILAATGRKPTIHAERIAKSVGLGKVVFLAVDTMASRKEIFENCLHLKFTTDLVVETRMGAEELHVYAFNPRDRSKVEAWKATLSDDDKTVESVCGTRITVGATAAINAGLAVTSFLQWYRRELVRDPAFKAELPLEQVMMLRPLITMTN